MYTHKYMHIEAHICRVLCVYITISHARTQDERIYMHRHTHSKRDNT